MLSTHAPIPLKIPCSGYLMTGNIPPTSGAHKIVHDAVSGGQKVKTPARKVISRKDGSVLLRSVFAEIPANTQLNLALRQL